MDNSRVLAGSGSLVYGTMDDDEIFIDIEGDIREQEQEAKRSILMNLLCVTTALTVLVIIIATTSTDQTY